jgi:biopolymer transport protein ExbD
MAKLGIVRSMNTLKSRTALVLVSFVLMQFGCGSKEEVKAPAQPIVGILELPVSLRSNAAEPTDAHKVEINLTELRVDDGNSLKLDVGKIAASERSGTVVPKLDAALSSPARTRLAIEVHSTVPYETIVAVLESARKAGIRNASFKVRKPGGGAATGWLEFNDYDVIMPTEDEVKFDRVAPHEWADFVNAWDLMAGYCRRSPTGSCVEKPVKIAEGGHVQIELFSAGTGVNFKFTRVGAPPPEVVQQEEEKKLKRKLKPEEKSPVLAGLPPDLVEKFDQLPFATEAGFQFRGSEAVKAPSALTATMEPVCGKTACGIVVTGRHDTVAIWLIAMIGAAFPDGTAAPQAVFVKLAPGSK